MVEKREKGMKKKRRKEKCMKKQTRERNRGGDRSAREQRKFTPS